MDRVLGSNGFENYLEDLFGFAHIRQFHAPCSLQAMGVKVHELSSAFRFHRIGPCTHERPFFGKISQPTEKSIYLVIQYGTDIRNLQVIEVKNFFSRSVILKFRNIFRPKWPDFGVHGHHFKMWPFLTPFVRTGPISLLPTQLGASDRHHNHFCDSALPE